MNCRMNHIIQPNGRTLIVAMDHSLLAGPCMGLEKPGEIIEKVAKGGADAIITSYGVAKNFFQELSPIGLILRIDGGLTNLGPTAGPESLFFRVEDALCLDADAVVICVYPGTPQEKKTLENLAEVITRAHAWELPVLAEMAPGGLNKVSSCSVDDVALSARVGAELGADMIKTPFVSKFEVVVNSCYVPVVVLGGSKRATEIEILSEVKAALDVGVSGIAIGRNIFQAKNPEKMTRALASLIHYDASIEEAVDIATH